MVTASINGTSIGSFSVHKAYITGLKRESTGKHSHALCIWARMLIAAACTEYFDVTKGVKDRAPMF